MDRADLEQVFGVAFRSSRENWKASCPFHDENTPSFYVHKTKYIANCFGCGIRGPVEKLAAQLLSISTVEARKSLNITIEDALDRSRSASKPVERTVVQESWLAPFKKEAHRYVIQRGFTVETLLLAASVYDASRKRQIFPHRDRDGRLLGASGRSCIGEDPKWLFYWDYDKGAALYLVPNGVSRSTESEPAPGVSSLIIVEGIFDALWFAQNGYTNVAATQGTEFTMRQVREIRSLTDHVYLALDNDSAGREATEKLFLKLKRNTDVSFCSYPPGYKDPVGMTKDELDSMVETATNHVQRNLIRSAGLACGEADEQASDASRMGTGDRENSNLISSSGKAV